MGAVLAFGGRPDAAAEMARRSLEELGLSDAQVVDLAAQRNDDLDSWERLSTECRDHEKALPEPVRALRRVHTLLLSALQESDDA